MKRFAFTLVFLSMSILAFTAPAGAESSIRLVGNHPAAAEESLAIANLDATTPLTMEIHLKLRNPDRLHKFLDELQDPGSPNYHKFLEAGEFDRLYGPSQADIDRVAKWLGDEGFTVTSTSGSVQFTGTVEQAERSFAVHMVKLNATAFTNQDDPMLPESIAAVVGNLEGLDNLTQASPVMRLPRDLKKLAGGSSSRKLTRAAALARAMHSSSPLAITQPSVNIGDRVAFGDADMRNTYDVPATGSLGSGGCIAIVGQSDYLDASLTTFQSQFSDLPGFNVTRVQVGGSNPGTGSNNEVETDLDLEWSHVMAPGAATRYYFGSGNLEAVINQAVNEDACQVISVSFEFCGGANTFFSSTLDSIFAKAAAQGQSVFISSGDHGAAGSVVSSAHCVAGSGKPTVSEMSADPNVTSVGGTQIDSPDYNGSSIAQGYATETVWNDGSSGGASGGGASAIFAKPNYQVAPGVPNDKHRDVPDVVLLGGPPAVFIGGDSGGSADLECCVEGTSLAAPLWAGMAKDIESAIGSPLGLINPRLYVMASLQYGGSASPQGFHDITSGNNSFNGVTGFTADTGYDKASGIGSVDFNVFETAFENAPEAPPTTLTPTPSAIDFGSLDASSISKPKKFVFKNQGPNKAAIGAVAISGPNSSDFKIKSDGCSNKTIAVKHSCAVMVTFAPLTPVGAESATLAVPYSGGPTDVSLTGISTEVTVTVPSDVTFAPAPAGGTSAPQTITLTNNSKTVTIMVGQVVPAGPFNIKKGGDKCSGKSVGHGKHCSVKMTSNPPSGSSSGDQTFGGLGSFDFTYGVNSGTGGYVSLTGNVK